MQGPRASVCRGRVGRVRAGPKEMFDCFLCVLCGFARNSSSKIRELECEKWMGSLASQSQPTFSTWNCHELPTNFPKIIEEKLSVQVRACPWLLSFATDVHRQTRTDWSSVRVRACPWLLSFATDVHRLTRTVFPVQVSVHLWACWLRMGLRLCRPCSGCASLLLATF